MIDIFYHKGKSSLVGLIFQCDIAIVPKLFVVFHCVCNNHERRVSVERLKVLSKIGFIQAFV